MFPCSIQIQGTEYNSAEQAFCHFKATEHGHQPSAEKILATTDPFAALEIAKGIKECEAWSAGKLDTLEKIVKAKFDQNPSLLEKLKATGASPLYEATRDPYYGCGLTLMQASHIDTRCPGKNKFGQLLQKIRLEL